jgi:protein-S-isoprenylcysteine O-methyltransferase Ste14
VETVAYYVALVTIVAVPAAGLVWFLVHPLAPWWRKVGPLRTYLVVGAAAVAAMWGIYLVRGPLLKIRFGVRMPLAGAAVVVFGIGSWIRAQVRRQLPAAVVLGLPEISANSGGRLITEGIYSRIRHPRYVGVGFGVAAMAMFANYLAPYVLAAAYVPAIYLIVLLEERELEERFGEAYRAYCKDVPRFLPRFGHGRIRRNGAT